MQFFKVCSQIRTSIKDKRKIVEKCELGELNAWPLVIQLERFGFDSQSFSMILKSRYVLNFTLIWNAYRNTIASESSIDVSLNGASKSDLERGIAIVIDHIFFDLNCWRTFTRSWLSFKLDGDHPITSSITSRRNGMSRTVVSKTISAAKCTRSLIRGPTSKFRGLIWYQPYWKTTT